MKTAKAKSSMSASTVPKLVPVASATDAKYSAPVTAFKHILIATDGSPISNKAGKAAIALALALHARVTAYCAIEDQLPIYSDGFAFDQAMIDRIEEARRTVRQKHVDVIGKLAKTAGVPFASVVAKAYSPDEGIIATAKKHKCDVIFMASHGRRGLSKLFMGSVTQNVLTHTKLPVVVYR